MLRTMIVGETPIDIGLPSKFKSWRRFQEQCVADIIGSTSKFNLLCAPTGFGKSLVYMAVAQMAPGRVAILTTSKGLQDQLKREFGHLIFDIRGMNNYDCLISDVEFGLKSLRCSDGPCLSGMNCSVREAGCLYYDAYREACKSRVIVTNYAYWMSMRRRERSLGQFQVVICDEGHDLPEEVAGHVQISLPIIQGRLLHSRLPSTHDPISEWVEWAKRVLPRANRAYEDSKSALKDAHSAGSVRYSHTKQVREARSIQESVNALASITDVDEWVTEATEDGVTFKSVWPGNYAGPMIWDDVEKVVAVSATLRPKTMDLLGVKEFIFKEYESSFDRKDRPVRFYPLGKINARTSMDEMRRYVVKVDQLINDRLDRKGIIHAVSYDRAKFIKETSAFGWMMMINNRLNTRDTVEKFKLSTTPVILISPSVSTGYDFPYDQCEYQIIAKIPFPDMRSPVVSKRQKRDSDYINYVTMQELVQMSGRGMRSADDRCETIITDENFKWFYKAAQQFAPAWWRESVKRSFDKPRPLEKLRMVA